MNSHRSAIFSTFAVLAWAQLAASRASAQEYVFSTLAGVPGSPGAVDGPAEVARFQLPLAVAVDAFGNVYVVEDYHTVRKITPGGEVTTLAGVFGLRGTADGLGPAARFDQPSGIAVTPDGDLLVADRGNQTIRKISPAGMVTTFAGSAGNAGYVDGIGGAARFTAPSGIATDLAGNAYVADRGNRVIRRISPAGKVETFAGRPLAGAFVDGPAEQARFFRPTDVCVDGIGTVYVVDADGLVEDISVEAFPFSLLRKISPSGVVTTLPGFPDEWVNGYWVGYGYEFFRGGVTVDAAGKVLVAAGANNAIIAIGSSGAVTTAGGFPWSYARYGNYTNWLAQSAGHQDGASDVAKFNKPGGVTVDGAGNIYIADTANHTIRKGTPALPVPRVTSAAVVTGVPGRNFNYTITTTPTPQTYLANGLPAGLSLDTATGVISGIPTVAGTFRVVVGATSDAGTGSAVLTLTLAESSQFIFTTLAGSPRNPGSADGIGDSARFNRPDLIAVSASGVVHVSDAGSRAIRTVAPDGSVGTLALLDKSLTGLAVDITGNVYFTEAHYRHAVRKIAPDGSITVHAGALDSPGNIDGAAGIARFNNPRGLAIDESGKLYVADMGNLSIRCITADGIVSTIADLSSLPRPSLDPRFGASVPLIGPTTVVVDRSGNLLVTDVAFIWDGDIDGDWDIARWRIGLDGVATSWPVSPPASPPTWRPRVSATDRTDNLYLADGRTVFRVTPSGEVQTLGGNSSDEGTADGAGATARFNGAYYVAVDAAGSIYVADTENHTIRKGVAVRAVGGGPACRLVNLSVRANIGTGRPLIAGVATSGGTVPVLVRALGPGLSFFMPPATSLAGDPRLALFDGASMLVQANDNWGGSLPIDRASAAVGAFPLFASSRDAALLLELSGPHTAQFHAATNGVGLLEIYDADSEGGARLINLSARHRVGSGPDSLIAGFVIEGAGGKAVLIRGVGPTLAAAPFNVAGALSDPLIEVFNSAGQRVAGNDDWASSLSTLADQLGAFALPTGSRDAAVLITLQPGAYTAVLTEAEGRAGEGLIEVYEVQ